MYYAANDNQVVNSFPFLSIPFFVRSLFVDIWMTCVRISAVIAFLLSSFCFFSHFAAFLISAYC